MKTVGKLGLIIGLLTALGGSPALADGDPAAGKAVFQKCAACHALEAGKTKLGPSLSGLFGRKAGSSARFRYSQAMKSSPIVWNEETLNRYLASPRDVVPGNRMPFPGLKDQKQRADLISYLKQVTK